MRAHPYMFLLCYLRNYLQNRSPHKYSGDASDTLRRCATLCILFGSSSLGEDKLARFARILLLLTLTLARGCFQLHSILQKDSACSFPEVPFPFSFQLPQAQHPVSCLTGCQRLMLLPPTAHLDFSFEHSIPVHQKSSSLSHRVTLFYWRSLEIIHLP